MARIITSSPFAWGPPTGQQELEIIPLRHQTPDRVLPALQPLVNGGSLSAATTSFFCGPAGATGKTSSAPWPP